MKTCITLFLVLLSTSFFSLYSQITTQFVTRPLDTYPGIKSVVGKQIKSHSLNPVDRDAELKKDSLERPKRGPHKFGKSLPVNIDLIKEASTFSEKDSIYYIYKIIAQDAQSINLIFDRMILPESSKLWIYNDQQIYGPVSSESNIKDGREFWTDIIFGSNITIQITVPKNSLKGNIDLHISKAIHGYNSHYFGYGTSACCNRDVVCPEGSGWADEANSVALILMSGGTSAASGSLINNTCQNYRPYFLTAFHILDGNVSGTLDASERSGVSSYVFRFKYQSPSCGGPNGAGYISFNGATFRSAFYDSDMALFELNATPAAIRDNNLSLAGWSRSSTAATSGAAIHHPAADVKKISIENHTITNVAGTSVWVRDLITGLPILTAPANTHWEVLFDSGTVQHGSSGSPFFNQNKQIVGQLHGDYLDSTGIYCDNRRGHYGRFDVSWIGGGAADSGLRNWLDSAGVASGTTSPTTLNTLNTPNVSGPYIVCTSANYTISNLASGASVVWSSSNSSLLPINSSTGVATKSGAPSSNGWVTLTATITMPSCSQNVTRTKQVWAGPPKVDNINNTTGYTICTGIPETLVALPAPQAIGTSYYWTIVSASSGYFEGGVTNQSYAEFTNPTAETTQIAVAASNSCGSQGASINLTSVNCLMSYTVYPNPASDFITIGFDEPVNFEGLPIEIVMYSEKSTNPLQTIDVRKVFSQKGFVNDKEIKIDVKNLSRGVYYLHFKYDNESKPKSHRIILE